MEAHAVLDDLGVMLAKGVLLDPLLANHYPHDSSPECASILCDAAQNMSDDLFGDYVPREQIPASVEVPYAPTLMLTCLRDTLLSTALWVAYDTRGSMDPTLPCLEQAQRRVIALLEEIGAFRLYFLYFVIAGHDALQPLFYHREIPEAEFLAGIRHHPYRSETLELILLIGLAMRTVRLKSFRGVRAVQVTKFGQEAYLLSRDLLRDSGYVQRRVQFSYVYQFDNVQDWDQMCRTVWPNAEHKRSEYVQWVGSLAGKTVLEVACGTGALTFSADLWRQVGASGRLTAIDISSGMLDQARRKWLDLGSPAWVEFLQASVERLPFADCQFDACLGSAFLHFVDPIRTLREMRRVVHPGGRVAVYQGIRFPMMVPFFRDWFEPMFDIARRRNADQPHDYLPQSREEVLGWFEAAGLVVVAVEQDSVPWIFDNPEVVVQHLFRGVSFFQTELMDLPWGDRKSVLHELIERGRDVCRRYTAQQRRFDIPMLRISSRVPAS